MRNTVPEGGQNIRFRKGGKYEGFQHTVVQSRHGKEFGSDGMYNHIGFADFIQKFKSFCQNN